MGSLAFVVEQQGVSTQHAPTCREALAVLRSEALPHMIFADTTLEDGGWEDVVVLARQALVPVNVIVVSKTGDVALYLESIDRGAFDFVTPPFEARDMVQIIRSALSDIVIRRRDLAELKARKNHPGDTLMLACSAV
jgi:DNA-binding NtrC family response regulator